MTYGHFTELPCWQACRDVVQWAWQIAEKFPPDEKYDLVEQHDQGIPVNDKEYCRRLWQILL
jgi:hypothetical protein